MKVSMGVYAILWTQTMDALVTMVVLPSMPFYAMTLGADALALSLLGSAYNFAQMLCSPALGALSDRVGRRNVMLVGLSAQAICNFMMSQTASLEALLLVRICCGIALSTGPVEMAYVMDGIQSETDMSHVLALQRVMTSGGALLGPIVARWFDDYPFQVLCRGMVAINIANIIVGFFMWEDVPKKDEAVLERSVSGSTASSSADSPPASFFTNFRSMMTNDATASLLLVSWIYTLSFGIADGPEIMFFKEHFGFGKNEVCNFFVVTNLSSLLCSSLVPSIIDSLGPRTTCKVGCLGAAATLLMLVICDGHSAIPYVAGALEVGLFGSMIGLSFMHLVRRTCPEALMGTMLGLQSSLNGFAGTIAPPTGGALYDWNNFLPYVLSAMLAAMAAGLYSAFPAVPPPPPEATRPLAQIPWKRPKLRRVSTFGQPIYPDKSFTTQVQAHCLRLEMDPETYGLYKAYRNALDRSGLQRAGTNTHMSQHGHGSPSFFQAADGESTLKHSATIPGDMVAAQAHQLSAAGQAVQLGRSDTYGTFVPLSPSPHFENGTPESIEEGQESSSINNNNNTDSLL